jgi:hypothetical protein
MSRLMVWQTDVRFERTLKMLKYLPLLLLAAVIGCTQGSAPDAVPESTTGITTEPASTEVAMELPDASATTVQFYCPGMT